MISDNIRKYRKSTGLNQQQLADRLNVVRQTVSKWENGLSVPDADMLVKLGEVLEVSVNELLDIPESSREEALEAELSSIREQQKTAALIAKKRGIIVLLSFLAMLIMLVVKSTAVSLALSGAVMITAAAVLYRNIPLLTSSADDCGIRAVKITTIFSIALVAVCVVTGVLTAADVISIDENGEKILALSIVCAVMIFAGIISARLPLSSHTGLRLPWTVGDEETWNLAHRIMGIISLPLALVYIALALTAPYFEAVSAVVLVLWLGVPSVTSLVFFLRKFKRR